LLSTWANLGKRLVEHGALDLAPLAVVAVELDGQLGGLAGLVAGQEACAQVRAADPPAGVDPGPEQEASVIGAGRLIEPRHVGEGRQAGVAPAGHDLEPLGDEGSVEPGQGHHVADRA
jgi:hypothetical protein